MKILPTIILSLFILTSCDSDKIISLEEQISTLEKINKNLIDSISDIEKNKISASHLILIPEKNRFLLNKPNRFTGVFIQDGNFPKYDLYVITRDSTGQKKRTLIQEGNTTRKFKYEFTPKSKKDNRLELYAEFEKDTIKKETRGIIAEMNMEIE